MSSNQNKKSKFRSTSVWKKFRKKIGEERKVDFITQKKLYKGWQLHHLDLDGDNYEKLIPENFLACNKMTHENIHFLYNLYKNDRDVLERIKTVLDKMVEINKK